MLPLLVISIRRWCPRHRCRSQVCRNEEETKEILDTLDRNVGLVVCNRVVAELLNGALIGAGKAALGRLPEVELAASRAAGRDCSPQQMSHRARNPRRAS